MKKHAAPPASPDVITSIEAAALAGVTARTIVRWFAAGKVAGRKAGPGLRSVVLVERVSLEALIAARTIKPEKQQKKVESE